METESYRIKTLSLSDKILTEKLNRDRRNCFKYKLTRSYLNFIRNYTYSHSVVVTFKYDFTLRKSIDFTNKLLHFVNRRIFGKKYLEKDKFIDGFLIVEKHKSGRYHFNVLIKKSSNIQYDEYELLDILNKCSNRVTSDVGKSGYKIFGSHAFNVSDIYDENGAIGYDTKDIWMYNGESVYPITKYGVQYIGEI